MGPISADTPFPVAMLIPAGLNPGRILFFDGFLMEDARWFCFSLQCGPSLEGDADVIFIFIVRIQEDNTTFSLNSFLKGRWYDANAHQDLCDRIRAKISAISSQDRPGTSTGRKRVSQEPSEQESGQQEANSLTKLLETLDSYQIVKSGDEPEQTISKLLMSYSFDEFEKRESTTKDKKQPKKEVKTQEVNTQEVSTQKVNTRKVNTQEVNTQELNTQELNTQELNTQGVNTQEKLDSLKEDIDQASDVRQIDESELRKTAFPWENQRLKSQNDDNINNKVDTSIPKVKKTSIIDTHKGIISKPSSLELVNTSDHEITKPATNNENVKTNKKEIDEVRHNPLVRKTKSIKMDGWSDHDNSKIDQNNDVEIISIDKASDVQQIDQTESRKKAFPWEKQTLKSQNHDNIHNKVDVSIPKGKKTPTVDVNSDIISKSSSLELVNTTDHEITKPAPNNKDVKTDKKEINEVRHDPLVRKTKSIKMDRWSDHDVNSNGKIDDNIDVEIISIDKASDVQQIDQTESSKKTFPWEKQTLKSQNDNNINNKVDVSNRKAKKTSIIDTHKGIISKSSSLELVNKSDHEITKPATNNEDVKTNKKEINEVRHKPLVRKTKSIKMDGWSDHDVNRNSKIDQKKDVKINSMDKASDVQQIDQTETRKKANKQTLKSIIDKHNGIISKSSSLELVNTSDHKITKPAPNNKDVKTDKKEINKVPHTIKMDGWLHDVNSNTKIGQVNDFKTNSFTNQNKQQSFEPIQDCIRRHRISLNQRLAESGTPQDKSSLHDAVKVFNKHVAANLKCTEKEANNPTYFNTKRLFDKIVQDNKRMLKKASRKNINKKSKEISTQTDSDSDDGEEPIYRTLREQLEAIKRQRAIFGRKYTGLNVLVKPGLVEEHQTIHETGEGSSRLFRLRQQKPPKGDIGRQYSENAKRLGALKNAIMNDADRRLSASIVVPEYLLREPFADDELHQLDLRPGDIFKIAFECLKTGFMVTLNGELVCLYPRLVSFKRISHLVVAGEVYLDQIEVGGGKGPQRRLLTELVEAFTWTEVEEITDDTFDSLVLQSHNMWVLCLYVPWCPACASFLPIWETCAATLKKHKMMVGAIDGDRNEDIIEQLKIPYYPCIICFPEAGQKTINEMILYAGARNKVVEWAENLILGQLMVENLVQSGMKKRILNRLAPLYHEKRARKQPLTYRKVVSPLERRGYRVGGWGYDGMALCTYSYRTGEENDTHTWHAKPCKENSPRFIDSVNVHSATTVVYTTESFRPTSKDSSNNNESGECTIL